MPEFVLSATLLSTRVRNAVLLPITSLRPSRPIQDLTASVLRIKFGTLLYPTPCTLLTNTVLDIAPFVNLVSITAVVVIVSAEFG